MKYRIGMVVGLAIVLAVAFSLAQPPGGKGGPGGRGRPGGSGAGGYSLDNTTVPKDDVEKRILAAIGDITQKQGFRMNVPAQDGRMLRLLAESIGAKTVVEIGTSNGISAIWFAMAMRKTDGKVITHEIDPATAKLARENFKTAGVSDMITIVEGDAHETVSKLKGPIDMVFIDADKEGYADYLKKLLPLMRPGGLICAHNINSRQANPEFIKAATTNSELETVLYSAGGGLSISLKKR
jgi:caffeoyl-CoA O-methyltransferase